MDKTSRATRDILDGAAKQRQIRKAYLCRARREGEANPDAKAGGAATNGVCKTPGGQSHHTNVWRASTSKRPQV